MNIIHATGFIFIFAISLLSGFQIGADFSLFDADDVSISAAPISVPLDPTPFPGQHNILMINVDRADTLSAQLESVWLVIYYSNSPRVDLFPIFPSPADDSHSRNQAMADAFCLLPNGEPGEEFWHQMQTFTTWWDGYFLIDEIAAAKLVDFMGGADIVNATAEPYQVVEDTSLWYEDPQAALLGQAAKYREQCQNFAQSAPPGEIISLLDTIHTHLHTDLDNDQISADWQLLRLYGGSLHCEFPTLMLTTP